MKKTSYLIVDANSFALKELNEILQYIGYQQIQTANSANSAWNLLRMKGFDCVIAAWDMPEMNGLALLRVVRNDERYYNLPFFLTDPEFTKVKVIQAGQAGVTGLIVKPYDVKNFQGKMNMLEAPEQAAPAVVKEAEKTLNQGLEMLEKQNYKQAIEVFEKMTEEGETAEYYYNLGYMKTKEGKYGEAIAAFRKATQLDRLFAKAYEAMGRCFQKMGRSKDAEKYLQKAADIYMSKEKSEDAETILNEILEIGSDSINVYNSLGVLYRRRGDYKTALSHYQRALRIHPKEPFIHYNIGRLYLDMRDPQKAVQAFEAAVKINPDFKEAKEVLSAIQLGTV